MFYQLPEHPLTQSSQQINLTIKMEQGEHSLQFAFTFFFLYLNIFSHTQFLFKGLEFITTNPIIGQHFLKSSPCISLFQAILGQGKI